MNWIGLLLLILHIGACTGLILIVLLQAGKGASLGAAFGGGSSQTVFGAQSASFIGKLTWLLAGTFMLTSLLLAIISPYGNSGIEGGAAILQEEPVAEAPLGEPIRTDQPGTMPSAEGIFVPSEQPGEADVEPESMPPAENHMQTGPEPDLPLPDTEQQP